MFSCSCVLVFLCSPCSRALCDLSGEQIISSVHSVLCCDVSFSGCQGKRSGIGEAKRGEASRRGGVCRGGGRSRRLKGLFRHGCGSDASGPGGGRILKHMADGCHSIGRCTRFIRKAPMSLLPRRKDSVAVLPSGCLFRSPLPAVSDVRSPCLFLPGRGRCAFRVCYRV